MVRHLSKRGVGVLLAAVLLAAGCGGDDGGSSASSAPASSTAATSPGTEPGTSAATSTQTPETTAAPATPGVYQEVPLDPNFDPAGVFVWGFSIAASSMDPHRGNVGSDVNWLYPVYDRLVRAAPGGAYEPMLAESWELNEDGTVLTFQVREGALFHDGTPVDAAAVKASLDRARAEDSTVKAELADVTDVRVAGPLTVELALQGGAGSIFGALSDRPGMIIAPSALDNPDLGTAPVGAGPYVVAENRIGDRVIYEKFAGYWDPEVQRTAGLEYRLLPDQQARMNALFTGELDMMVMNPAGIKPVLDQGFSVFQAPGPQFIGISVNSANKPFDDPRVRRALWQAIDREGIAEVVLGGACTPQIQFWPEISWAYDDAAGPGLDVWPYDPAAARALLEEAGYGDGFEFSFVGSDIASVVPIVEVLQQNFAEIGVTLNLELVEAAQVFQRYKIDKAFDASLEVYVASPDPDGVLSRVLLPTALGNPGGQMSDRVVELAGQARSAVDVDERAALYHEINQELIDFVPHIGMICMQDRTEAFRPGVSGLAGVPSGTRDFRGVAVSPE